VALCSTGTAAIHPLRYWRTIRSVDRSFEFAFADTDSTGHPTTAVVTIRKRLLGEAGVAVLADIHFGSRVPGEGQHVRFSYAASKQAIEAGVQRMADFIRNNTRKAA